MNLKNSLQWACSCMLVCCALMVAARKVDETPDCPELPQPTCGGGCSYEFASLDLWCLPDGQVNRCCNGNCIRYRCKKFPPGILCTAENTWFQATELNLLGECVGNFTGTCGSGYVSGEARCENPPAPARSTSD